MSAHTLRHLRNLCLNGKSGQLARADHLPIYGSLWQNQCVNIAQAISLPRLEGELRERFLAIQADRSLPIVRMAYIAAAVLMLLFIGWDALIDTSAVPRTLPVRAACSVAFVALFLFARARGAVTRLNMLNVLASLVAGFGISIVLGMLPRGFDFGAAGLTMVVFAGVAVTPTWRHTSFGGLVVMASANGVMLLTGQGWFTYAQVDGYLLTSVVLAGLLSYFLEQRHLRAFLLESELQRQATTDMLTGAANRRHFMDTAQREIERARRYGNKLSMLMLDIDHFKRVNDTYGHAVGDEVLRQLPKTVTPLLRKLDFMGRLGGEEFAILLVETDGDAAAIVAERLRKGLQGVEVRTMGVQLHFTVSIGCTEVRVKDQGEDVKAALERADEALYRAKDSGRNKVVVG